MPETTQDQEIRSLTSAIRAVLTATGRTYVLDVALEQIHREKTRQKITAKQRERRAAIRERGGRRQLLHQEAADAYGEAAAKMQEHAGHLQDLKAYTAQCHRDGDVSPEMTRTHEAEFAQMRLAAKIAEAQSKAAHLEAIRLTQEAALNCDCSTGSACRLCQVV